MRHLLFFFLIAFISCSNDIKTIPISSNFQVIPLAEGVYAATHKLGGKAICNIGIIDNGKETIIFDSFLSPEVAEEIKPLVKQLGLSPIRYIINSHYHNDHIRGNQVFSDDIEIISTKKTAELIAHWEPQEIESEKEYGPVQFAFYDSLLNVYSGDKSDKLYSDIQMWRPYYEVLSNSHKEVITRIPNMIVDDGYELNGPQRKVSLITKGKGHTESDLVLYLPDDKVLFTGDLVFNKCHPYLAHGYIGGWKQRLDFLQTLEIEHLVPGHGNTGDKSTISSMKDYIIKTHDHAIRNIENGLTPDDQDFFTIPSEYKEWWFGKFYKPNLIFMYENEKKRISEI